MDGSRSDEVAVVLVPMTAARYEQWRSASVQSYGEDIATSSGMDAEDANRRAATQFDELLPDGQKSAGTWLLTIQDDTGAEVGSLWLGPHPQRDGVGYVFDIEIAAAHRGRGLGRATMLAAEALLREAGIAELGLNVFGFNAPARRLYESLGYRVVATQMIKTL